MQSRSMTLPGKDPWAGADSLVVLALVLFAVFFRLATLMPIHTGVDERDYWFSAKCISQGWPYPPLTHRTARFAVILPTAGAQALLGESPNVYYVTPALNAALQAALAFAVGRKLKGRAAGFLAALGLTLFPYMIRAGSQVRPEVFSITYVLAALWLFLVYLDRAEGEGKRFAPLLGASALLFVAYEANITNLFFVPGLAAAMLAKKRPVKEIFAFCGLLLALFLAETAAYAAFTPFKLGQLQVIARSHLEGNEALKTMSGLLQLFDRYRHPYLQTYWQASFLAFAVAGGYFFLRRGEAAVRCVVAAALGYFVCVTFAVKSLNPLVPAEPFINRYFCAVLGPIAVVLAAFAVDILERIPLFERLARKTGTRGAKPYVATLALAAALITVIFSSGLLPRRYSSYAHSLLRPAEHPLEVNLRYRKAVDEAWDKGLPIVAAAGVAGDNAIQSCVSYYLSASRIPDGKRPETSGAVAAGREYLVVSREPKPLLGGSCLAALRQPFRLVPAEVPDLPRILGKQK